MTHSFNVIKKILLPHQAEILILLLLALLLSILFWIIGLSLFSTPQGDTAINQDELAKCTNNFCILIKKIQDHPNDVIPNATDIFINNLVGTYYIFVSQPIFINPLLDTFYLGSIFGTSVFNSPHEFINEMLFPHGWLEVGSFIFIYSLFYTIAINFFLVIKRMIQNEKKNLAPLIRRWVIQAILQFGVFLVMLWFAGILEAIGIASKF